MLPSWYLLGVPCLVALSAVVVRFMIGAGVVDRPDARKSHDRPTPKGGGAGPVVAVVVGALVAGLAGVPVFHPLALLAAAGLAALALLDDTRDFPFTVKLAAQVLAAVLAVASGLALPGTDLAGTGLSLGVWAVPVTLAWILFTTNAVNFIDGLNGLAAGSSLLAAVLLAMLPGEGSAFPVCVALAAGLAGFLPFNYPRARIFMGDVGSQFCGFLLAVLSVAAAGNGAGTAVLAGPVLLCGILFDVAFTLARRALARQRVWEPHRGHLYQVAQRSGMPAPVVSAVHWTFVLWGGAVLLLIPHRLGWAVAAALAPQAVWTVLVVALARRAGITRW